MEIGVGGSVSTQTANFNTPAVARENEAPGDARKLNEEQTESAATQASEGGSAPAAAAPAPANDRNEPVQAAAGPGKGSQLDISA